MTTFVRWVILSQPLVFGVVLSGIVSIGLIAMSLVDVVRACIAITKYDTLTLVIRGQPACKTLFRHAFRIQDQASGQIAMARCAHYTEISSRRSPEVVASKRWILVHYLVRCVGRPCTAMQSNFYHDCGWGRALPAATTLKRGVSAFFPSTYFETL
jgi:hypothetical protein